MYKHCKRGISKGYVLIYVLLVGSLCLLSSFFVFEMEMSQKESISLYKNEVTSDNKLQECRENLLTDIDTMVNSNVSSKDVLSLKTYLAGLPLTFKIYYQNSYISYDNIKDKIFIDYYINGLYYKTEYYSYYVDNLKVKYKCSDISYVKGMVN
jgi:hypothetical protein